MQNLAHHEQGALKIAGHVVQDQPGWDHRDVTMTWTLMLVCYYLSTRVGDIISNRVNSVTDKTLCWSDISFDPSRDKIVIRLRSSKMSVGNKGHAIVLTKNTVAAFCQVRHLTKLKSFFDEQGSVFKYISGKMLTPSMINRLLKRTSKLTGVLKNYQYSCHSLRAESLQLWHWIQIILPPIISY